MLLGKNNIKFGRVSIASGTQGFFGEGYWYHPILHPFGLDFDGADFAAKTTTFSYNKGFMPLDQNFTPRALFPDCIKVYPLKGLALNAVGLSGPGAKTLFEMGIWQERTKPFWLSFMAIGKTKAERIRELREYVALLKKYLPEFLGPVGLQINYSCPNTQHALEELLHEIWEGLTIAAELGIPLMPKLNILASPEAVRDISQHPNCDAVCISNTIPYGELFDRIPWKKWFGSSLKDKSPLAKYGGGGLSGKPLLPLLLEWIRKARAIGLTKPINAGGGIVSLPDAISVFEALGSDNDSIALGSIAFLRPWRVKKIIDAVNGN
jgi:dihydroorotate dehydrogenase